VTKLDPENYAGEKGYFCDADPSTQSVYQIDDGEFDAKAKLWLLLFDHLIISAGHMIESRCTAKWLLDNSVEVAKLAGENAIIPSLRNDRDSLYDFAMRHTATRDEPWNQGVAFATYLERAKRLDDVFPRAITWSSQAESSLLKHSLVSDLKRTNSPLRRRLIGLSKAALGDLVSKLEQTDYVTRRLVIYLAEGLNPRHIRTIQRYTDIFYHISGAREKLAYPLLHHTEAGLCRDQVFDEVSRSGQEGVRDLWREVLSSWILEDSLSASPLALIREIRKDALGKRVRKTWNKVLRSALSSESVEDALSSHLSARERLVQELRRELGKQHHRFDKRSSLRSVVGNSVWVTRGLAFILGLGAVIAKPLVAKAAFVTGILGLLSGPAVLDTIERKFPRTELVLLSTKIHSSKPN
jgi:hypothetical protein